MTAEVFGNRIRNRYMLHSVIGQGGMGIVYHATDRLIGREVALKRVLTTAETLNLGDNTEGADFRMALAREFKLSASLRHPHIVDVLDYGFDTEQQPYFTMELLPDPRTIREASANTTLERQLQFIVQLLHALTYLHRRGILHRDLKPANVLVVDDTIKVLDFGLSTMHSRTQSDSAADNTVGTLAYMAPEMLTGESGAEAADLYAVGIMAYEIIARKHPFNLEDPTLLINQILMYPPDFSALDVPFELINVLMRLVEKDPAERYSSAQEAIDAFHDAGLTTQSQQDTALRESFLQAARFVGREDELTHLQLALQQLAEGQSSTWLVAGESGVGKSRIIDEIRTAAMVKGVVVIRGQAVSVGGTPYQIWHNALRWVCLLSDDLNDDDIALLKLFISDLDRLISRDITHITPAQLKPTQIAKRMLALFERVLGEQAQPVLMLFEDLHWAGSESLAALARWTAQLSNLSVIVIGSFRDDERPHLASQLPDMRVLKLRRLDDHAIRELSTAMLGKAGSSTPVVDLLRRETEGNVFFLVETVRALAEMAGNIDNIGRTTLPAQVFAGGMKAVVERRLSRVDAAGRQLLQLAAVMGRELQLDVLQNLAPRMNISAWLTACVNAAVLEVDDDLWRFAHDKLREGLLQTMTETEIQRAHERVAQAIEGLHDEETVAAALAYHWGRAKRPAKEERFTTFAGEQALRTGAYDEALSYFNRAQILVAQFELSDNRRKRKYVHLHQRSGDVYLGLGQYEQAREHYRQSLVLMREIDDPVGIAVSLGHLGNVALATEDFSTARSLYDEALALYRSAGNKSGIARALNRLGDIAYEQSDQEAAKQYYQESLQLSRQIGEDWGMAGALRMQRVAQPATNTSLENLKALLTLAYEANDTATTLNTLLRIARVSMKAEATQLAFAIFAFLLHHDDAPEAMQDEAEQNLYSLQDSLDSQFIETVWEQSKTQTLTEVVTAIIA